MYDKHPTSVIHPVPTPQVEKITRHEQFAFNSDGVASQSNEDIYSSKTKMEIPVTFGRQSTKDATLSSYESPELKNEKEADTNFIEKANIKEETKSKFEESPEEAIKSDITAFVRQFENTKDKKEKLNIITEGRKRILLEAKDLKETIVNDIAELLESKKLAIRLNNVIQTYEKKLIDDQESKRLKLGDEISVKAALKARLQKEIEGIRVSSDEYKELDMVNPEDIRRLTAEIVAKLNGSG
jgi:hypothetical protein